ELQASPLRHVELGANFDVEFECHGPRFRDLDCLEIKLRLADGRKQLVFAQLFKTIHQQRTLYLVGNFVPKTILDQLARGTTGAKTGDVGLGNQVRKGIVEVTVDVGTRYGNGDMPLARTWGGHVDN